ncbi:Putative RpoE6 RNA polymerase sigma factor [Neorhizobium galegae bv. officinalis bv. officinalis str. HAMBI 1141]|uniref:Putative RpoE6 RNA polymerase sigma factor n=1 Tax=Neorhizobium galegae bv. officinalis bv. officinalis str. HAMBI 1141 TaxID=1028801 RepID=A0A068T903_NEOGA|nr:RNA polymerase sigma factor [Neorhizobium galegae]CDN54893.1 Putative RpoE6 RNA polymerase sigma factor [Neorhizobium galegae bv. officinalis bv. officinalis str. HAMBI 1141]
MTQPSPSTDIRRDLVALLPRLRRFALTLTGSAVEADDLVREAAGRAIQKSHHWKGEGRLESWLFSMIRGTFVDEAKKRRRADIHAADDASPAENSRPSTALVCLPDGLASVFLLADVEGFAYAEAAAILGIQPDLFATRLCAARLSLATAAAQTSERRA